MTLDEAINSKKESDAENKKREEEWMQQERF